jgi:hypothetical protein
MSAAVLKFSSAGVTHLLSIPPLGAALLVFMQSAEQQHYRPRYAVSSYGAPTFLAANAPPAQLAGALGIGWSAGLDVNSAQDPRSSPSQAQCLRDLKSSGQGFSGDGRRFALFIAYGVCDGLNMLQQAARKSNGLGAPSISVGLASLGTSFSPAMVVGNALSNANHAVAGGYRRLSFQDSCACFVYSGSIARL